MSRLVLVDTSEHLPGWVPARTAVALGRSELVLTSIASHPLMAEFDADERPPQILVPEADGSAAWTAAVLDRAGAVVGSPSPTAAIPDSPEDDRPSSAPVVWLRAPGEPSDHVAELARAAEARGWDPDVHRAAEPRGAAVAGLARVMANLRAPDGCPWDREQDHVSLGPHAIEETYELLEAIGSGNPDAIREELGDVLLQVVFHAQVAAERDSFDLDAVAETIREKLVRRHPHVFADGDASTPEQVRTRWEELKADEKPERTGSFDGVPTALPALQLITKYQTRAARLGFDWSDESGPLDDVRAELAEVVDAPDDGERAKEIGDLLAAVAGLARWYGVDPEAALRGSAERFRARFERVVESSEEPLEALTPDQWLARWESAKRPHGAG
ncbi:nucleoside triphosphate pyrophosphohydrolase [Egibacter rhizosphaerae]|uniref:Nucleoside triphosphate pyrophosphohydrolase n=1 Tax=Egibacter rhizosphaerae TaxID=1670831 RepID=A0A411YIJ8_9ACTN|nr:nucleoside triphosphate pyrophosphohydrolase [Egibacter rhizosphaerae]QBI21114.1 nucleoside triphosphate pyrophosphohydrolase [Egibacter rhizosphaerae]